MKANQNIRKLLLSSNLLGDTAIAHLAQSMAVNTGLELLLLADNPFGDEGGKHLTEALCYSNRSLRVLDIHGTHMSKAGGKQVCACMHALSSLLLHSYVNVQVVEQLHQLSSLTKLGSSVYGPKSSEVRHVTVEVQGQASRHARQRQEHHFTQQAKDNSTQLMSQLSPSHLF